MIHELDAISVAMTLNTTTPRYLDLLPDDVWVLVLSDLADTVSTTELLAVRLVCKKLASLIASEPVAYHAVIAANRSIMRDGQERHPRHADLPFSWWALLKDQVRLDRIWIKGTKIPPIPNTHFVSARNEEKPRVNPSVLLQSDWANAHGGESVSTGYDVTLLDHRPSPVTATDEDDEELMFLKSICTDIDPLTGQGLIAYLAFRRRKAPTIDYSIVVHIVKYPELVQLTSHTLRHPGFGSSTTDPGDLPMTGPGDEPLDAGRGLHVSLLRVDRKRQTYLVAYSDVNDMACWCYAVWRASPWPRLPSKAHHKV
ncbi:hypothetical protein BCR44DRAFT_1009306 [Catenaria anguillulae PL171]|uniref:Uncharacterized protein n=1 Tax=Catenaria anguillulae PL171 TaxID=765915 RepID=A0A1Y2I3V6_9FUNG|nr:hypothetical protein BCR44DRAFT_1009306 [Catenaria anguillulae PL171]